jgi:hypothetical protein
MGIRRTQAELQLRSTQLQVEQEVRDAHSCYQAAVQHAIVVSGQLESSYGKPATAERPQTVRFRVRFSSLT